MTYMHDENPQEREEGLRLTHQWVHSFFPAKELSRRDLQMTSLVKVKTQEALWGGEVGDQLFASRATAGGTMITLLFVPHPLPFGEEQKTG